VNVGDIGLSSTTVVGLEPFLEAGLLSHAEDCFDIHASLDALVRRRRELGISKADMARRLGISVYRINQFESEESDPTLSMMQQYARALGMRVVTSVARNE